MGDPPSIAEILSGGGVLAFAFVVWKGQQKIERLLERMTERLVRIDDRTFQAQAQREADAEDAAAVVAALEKAPRKRARTPVAGVRLRTQTPFMGEGEER